MYKNNPMLALHTIERRHTAGIPTGLLHIMEHSVIERLANVYPGSYVNDPHGVYIKMMQNAGVCMVDQYLAENPLSMEATGYKRDKGETQRTNEGGTAVVDGMTIRDPEDVAEHLEKYAIPRMRDRINEFSEKETIQFIINNESVQQAMLGEDILKAPYSIFAFPGLLYGTYGYEPFFTAYALYPELMERIFSLQADYAEFQNKAAVKAIERAGLPKYCRLDSDMADSRNMLCSMASLEKLWVPHFARSIKPAVDADFTLLWHCDGNLMPLVPYLLDCGVNGFQGFQYEDGMDYVKICKMIPKRGGRLVIQAGVSVTTTLPFGAPDDVAREVKCLAENGTPHMFLSFSSSCVPGTPYENIKTAIEGMIYYRLNGRK